MGATELAGCCSVTSAGSGVTEFSGAASIVCGCSCYSICSSSAIGISSTDLGAQEAMKITATRNIIK